ncbi:MAG: bifunctional response regulator/alkaline phosphatase family protein, partial [Candidatus Cloacimonetes bacterium]|nr:bifunctional response regulator/alkaline phosphatase family protein [Candidatus Cloacimonadota bacterium]
MRQLKILWVDDEIDLLKPFVIFLEERGYFVKTVSNGNDAVAIILEDKFDLILLDEMMPGMDGLATLMEIKKINPSMPIVMCTKSEEEGIMDKAIARQIDDYLIKPINPGQIIMTVKKIFQADEIRHNQVGQEYAQYIAKLNQRLFADPDWNDWGKIYSEICRWDVSIDELNEPNLEHTHFLEKRNCNTEFCNYIEANYADWMKSDNRPVFSFDIISEYITPLFEEEKPVYFIILDCMRLDQYYALEPYLKELFNVDLNLYFSILPTATPYS